MDNELFNYYLNTESNESNEYNEYNESNEEYNICLITNVKLNNNYITLKCGHKFNYTPLYYEIVYQKTKKILDNKKLKINEIKCPYCRQVTDQLLPHFKYYNSNLINGVNNPEKYCMKINECSYIKNNIKCTNNACNTKYGILCNKHFKYTEVEEEILDNIDNNLYNNLKKSTIKELKDILKENNCKLVGNKDDLIKRILINLECRNKI